MTDRIDQRTEIANALRDLQSTSLPKGAKGLFAELGYTSDRTLRITSTKQFHAQLDPTGRLTKRETESLGQLKNLHLLFQLTDAEFSLQQDLFDSGTEFAATQIHSYLFFAVELPRGQYTRTTLSTIVRSLNKPLPMPALVLFRYGETVSIGIIHRRLNKRDRSRDVLEKVTLIKDIYCADPIRAHLEILNDFVFQNLNADFGVSNFVRLHEAWQNRLGSYALSNEFYREIADWYFWAQHQIADDTIKLPVDCDTEEEQSLFLIRLLTRVIFCWFLVEKRLIPATLFRTKTLTGLIEDFRPSKDPENPDTSSTFYRAVLQNLFFGTLNMPPEQRSFREKRTANERYDKNRGATNLWRYAENFSDYNPKTNTSAAWLELAERIPFLNGGLFDCLDEKFTKKEKKPNIILDGFSDNNKESCHLPNDLFFGPERTEDLSKDYGEEKKKTARSKRAKVRGLIEILARYKFTVEENTPLEEEIALDPELLGKVFENLLASYNEDTRTTARKALGAFYTPREIVNYMVDESLKSYLAGQVPRCKGVLEELFSIKATLKDIRPEVRDALIAAIGNVKILDPACGSGAFPMGALHRLVDLLQKLDENNESWKRDRLTEAKRYRELLEEAGAEKTELSACDGRIADIEKSFDTRFHALDFARKLYLIENCIYGIDIQPIATQIAKLRFFISLIVDQKIDQSATNLGVRPLPNLETRIVAADTLIPIQKDDGNLFSGDLEKLRKELAAIRHDHFNARTPEAKRKCRAADEAKRQEIAGVLEKEHTIPTESAQQLAAWDPYDQNTHAPFFDSEWMFGLPVGKVKVPGKGLATLSGRFPFVNELPGQMELIETAEEESGFDIVIGNPPYVRIQTLKKKDAEMVDFFKKHYTSAKKGNYDVYVVFIEAGLKFLKADGHLAYICPHKFFNAKYGEPLRGLIAKGRHLRHVVHFGDEQVFPGATIYTCLLFLTNKATSAPEYIEAHDLTSWLKALSGERAKFNATEVTAAPWTFTVGPARPVFKSLLQHTAILGEIARIWQGVVTSADRLYVLQDNGIEDNEFVQVIDREGTEWNLERSMARPLIMDVPLDRYTLHEPTHRIIVPYRLEGSSQVLLSPSEIQRRAPNVWTYLCKNEDALRKRESGKTNDNEWYRYIYPKNLALFDSTKLIVQVMATEPRFVLDSKPVFFTGGGNGPYYGLKIIDAERHEGLLTLHALLNSKVAGFFISQTSTTFRGGYWSFGKQFIERIPIPSLSREQEDVLAKFVSFIFFTHSCLQQRSEELKGRESLIRPYFEQILNALTYQVYFPNEFQDAHLDVFSLIDQLKVPAVAGNSNVDIAKVVNLFEDVYELSHPIRVALDKVQTLDVVRVIEGIA
jgi:type I restriction-modification system DNA methylase subunit